MAQAKASKIINAPANWVRETVSAFSGLEKYLPMIAKTTTEGSGVGATRTCELADGAQLHERLEALDDQACSLTYSILKSPLPIENYLGTISVRDGGEGKSEVTWSANLDAPADQEPAMTEMLSGAFASGIDGLEKLHQG